VERTLWSGPNQVEVAVHEGEVTLRGEVETQDDLELLERLVELVPGVVAVTANVGLRAGADNRRTALHR